MNTYTIEAGRDIRETWQWRVLEEPAKAGGTMHWILRAAMHNNGNRYPRFGYGAEIGLDGMVYCRFALTPKDQVRKFFVDHVDNIVAAYRRLADTLKLDDKDREELFELLRSWMEKDHRAQSGVAGSDEK